jgi:hypothetical protein
MNYQEFEDMADGIRYQIGLLCEKYEERISELERDNLDHRTTIIDMEEALERERRTKKEV